MTVTTIDSIIRRYLLEKGLPIHYYAEALFNASTCFRELNIDTLQVVNTKRLPINAYFAVDLPEDFVDDVMVGVPAGQYVQPIPKKTTTTPLRLTDADGNYTTYATQQVDGVDVVQYDGNFIPAIGWYWNINDLGESVGRYFGASGGAAPNTYSIVRERRQIQLPESFIGTSIILMYISDGQTIDSASQIDVQAFYTIQSWLMWKQSPNANNLYSPEGRYYTNEKRKLRARMNELTLNDIKDIIRSNFHAGIKN
jgi:hypothetical protein